MRRTHSRSLESRCTEHTESVIFFLSNGLWPESFGEIPPMLFFVIPSSQLVGGLPGTEIDRIQQFRMTWARGRGMSHSGATSTSNAFLHLTFSRSREEFQPARLGCSGWARVIRGHHGLQPFWPGLARPPTPTQRFAPARASGR